MSLLSLATKSSVVPVSATVSDTESPLTILSGFNADNINEEHRRLLTTEKKQFDYFFFDCWSVTESCGPLSEM
jgi:hypothetical protein